MALNGPPEDNALPCGRSLERLWERLDDGAGGPGGAGRSTDGTDGTDVTDDHVRSCPHCSAALSGLGELRTATTSLKEERVRPARDLTARIMAAVRAEPRGLGAMFALDAQERGRTDISERAVAAIVRFAAEGVDGVRAGRCELHAAGTTEDGTAMVEGRLTVSVAYGVEFAGVLERVRRQAVDACTARVGVLLARLDIEVGGLDDGARTGEPGRSIG
ncbi:Asp23/Gls24 family envelope stress response protein [Prauserella cavernicola]|uniref:Asp23/Gls24 family envelope stress response protein n=1 Tax=Prauserella cavernicola TaxID=2800127 RepID=A0A934QLQ6_9PSEU|nr:Asp23/Gls24 family envelope stress response protein [Prauserella cavernicola]MBK1783382.1 Asp23/Gls24 family envelope stress response protein [Prauserella cavernicola]